jgi:arginine/ornithine N-succinyltransferase beta subunit
LGLIGTRQEGSGEDYITSSIVICTLNKVFFANVGKKLPIYTAYNPKRAQNPFTPRGSLK